MEQSLFGYYLLPEDAQLRLLQTRDHLRFLAALARPRCVSNTLGNNGPPIQMDALAFCFDMLAEQLNNVLLQTTLPGDMTERCPPS
ncbi:XAC0095 family protein [Xanthomonas campestris pv. fici]|uniref:XAC0095 family protein n=1 Tax=Xanthomonas euvesicatoria TaxID=456327 RepID=UPI003555DF7F